MVFFGILSLVFDLDGMAMPDALLCGPRIVTLMCPNRDIALLAVSSFERLNGLPMQRHSTS